MNVTIPIILLGVMILFAVWQGGVINWKLNENSRGPGWSKFWHAIGWAIRLTLQVILLLLTIENKFGIVNILLFQFLAFNIQWTIYDLVINSMRPTSLWYIDSKGINLAVLKVLKKVWIIWGVRIFLYETSLFLLLWLTSDTIDAIMGFVLLTGASIMLMVAMHNLLIFYGMLSKPNKQKTDG